MVNEEPEMEDVVSEPDEAAKEEAERLAREEEERRKVSTCSFLAFKKRVNIFVFFSSLLC